MVSKFKLGREPRSDVWWRNANRNFTSPCLQSLIGDHDEVTVLTMLILLPRGRLVGGGNLVAYVPEIFVEPAFHALLKNFHRRSHGADDVASNHPLSELQMMEAEKLHAFVEVEQALGNVVQSEELFVTAVQFASRDAGGIQLLIERFSQPWTDVEQRQESWGI